MKNIVYITLLLMTTSVYAQIGIGTNTPHSSATLDIVSADKGVLIPKVELTSTTNQSPIPTGITPAESLLVYNTIVQNDVQKGFYYWSNGEWKKLLDSAIVNESSLPWFNDSTNQPDATNTNSIYHKGNVSVGEDVSLGKLTVIASAANEEAYFSKYSNTASTASTIQFLRGRGTSYNNALSVTDNDVIGVFNFRGVGGVTAGVPQFVTMGSIETVADGTVSTTSTPGKLQFYVERYTTNDNPELKMELLQDGRVNFNQQERWESGNNTEPILAIDNSGYFKIIDPSTLRPVAANRLRHLGNGEFLLNTHDGLQEQLIVNSAFHLQEKQVNYTMADKLLVNTQDNNQNKFVTTHITKKQEDLSPLMIKNCPVFNTNEHAVKAGLEKGMIYRSPAGKLMIVN